jgi:hypothetical protein
MIIIENAINDNGQQYPSRLLTEKEKETVTSALFNGVEWVYYQGDEPPKVEQPYVEPVEEKTDISNIDIDSLTDEQILKLKARFEAF